MKHPFDIKIFVIDDDPDMVYAVGEILKLNGLTNYQLFTDPDELLENLTADVHICVVDYVLGKDKINGLELIKRVIAKNKHCWFIMLSGQNDFNVVVDYINSVYGGRYIEKGSKENINEELIKHITDIISHIRFIDSFYSLIDRGINQVAALKNILKGNDKPIAIT